MIYTVTIHWTGTSVEHVKGLSRANAQALADHYAQEFPAVHVEIHQG